MNCDPCGWVCVWERMRVCVHKCVCLLVRSHLDTLITFGLESPAWGERERARKGGNCYRAAAVSCVYTPQRFESDRVPILPLSLSLSGGWGQVSPTVVSAGLCGCVFILEPGLPSGSLHLSKHPSGRCSVFPASHGLLLSFSSRRAPL